MFPDLSLTNMVHALRRKLGLFGAAQDATDECSARSGIAVAGLLGRHAASWRLAESLVVLRRQVDGLAPRRGKASDGTIGDASHAARTSDHNPWVRDGGGGVVTAIDITHDPDRGCDSGAIAEALVAARDRRIKYVIWNRRIASAATVSGKAPWTWRPYRGSNPHSRHVHVSVQPAKEFYDDRRTWPLPVVAPEPDGRRIAWGARVDAAFRAKAIALCGRLDLDPDLLMAVIAFETGRRFRADTVNKASGATGLIQFMPATARALGTTTDALRGMSEVEQLDYVEAYLKPYKGRMKTVADAYMAVLWPAAVGKPETHVLFARPSKAYAMNKGLDKDKDGRVTKAEAARRVEKERDVGRQPGNMG